MSEADLFAWAAAHMEHPEYGELARGVLRVLSEMAAARMHVERVLANGG